MKKKLQVIIIFIFIIESISYVSAGEFGISNVSSAINEAEKLQADIQLKKTDNPKAEEAAKKAAEYFHSEECQSRINAESERIKKDLFQEYVKDEHSQKSRGLLETERIYIFISSSMPIATLKTYALEIEQIGDKNITMVMRGFVGGMAKFGPTMEFCQKVLMLDPDCNVNDCEAIRAQIEIDPNLFRKFGIKEVPAIVYAKNVNLIDPEQSAGVESNTKGNISGYRLYGAVPIDYALDKFYQESKSNNLKMLLSRARGSRE